MTTVWMILRKELKELAATRSMVVMGVIASLFFSLVFSGSGAEETILFAPLLVGLSLGYYGSSLVFLREKQDLVIESLLCSPATLRDLWLGKTLGVTLFAAVFTLGMATLTTALASMRAGSAVVPGEAAIVYLCAVVPLIVACLVGARGYVQLLFGMRESRLISLGFLMIVLFLVRALGVGTPSDVGDLVATGLGAAAVLTVLWVGSRFLSPERVVTTL